MDNTELSESRGDVMYQRLRLFYASISLLIAIGIVNFGAWMYNKRILKYSLTIVGVVAGTIFWYFTEDYVPPALFGICSLLGALCFYIKRAQEKRQERIWAREVDMFYDMENRHN